MTTRASGDVVRRAPRPGRVHPVLALVAAALATLIPLLGVGTPASARVAARSMSTTTTTAATPVAGSAVGSESRRTTRAAAAAAHTSGRRIQAPRSAADHDSDARAGGGGHYPTQPATGGLDRTGPPTLDAAHQCARQADNLTARITPIGAGRSPPSSCGS